MSDIDEIVRERAYELWEKAGRPDNRTLEFWFAAKREAESGAAPATAAQDIVEQRVLDEAAKEPTAPSAPKPHAGGSL